MAPCRRVGAGAFPKARTSRGARTDGSRGTHPLWTSDKAALSRLHFETQEFTGIELRDDFEGAATGLAIRREPLHPLTGIDGDRTFLSAERALHLFSVFHGSHRVYHLSAFLANGGGISREAKMTARGKDIPRIPPSGSGLSEQ